MTPAEPISESIATMRETPMPTALIVEDEPEANRLLGMLLKLKGYRSTAAHNGAEAFERLRDQTPDVIFLDLMLPDVNGYEICRSVKASKGTCLIPLVVVTARVASENRLESYQAGADGFIPKPYLPDQIFLALERAEDLSRRGASEVVEGIAHLATPDDAAAQRDLTHLRHLIFGRSPLAEHEVDRIGRLLGEVRAMIVRWSAAHPDEPPVTLSYTLSPDQFVLKFQNQLGWLDESTRIPNHSFTGALERFDEVVVDRGKAFMSLTKRWN